MGLGISNSTPNVSCYGAKISQTEMIFGVRLILAMVLIAMTVRILQ